MRDGGCAERGRVAAQEGWEAGFEALDAGCLVVGCCGGGGVEAGCAVKAAVGDLKFLPESGGGAWEHRYALCL